MLLVVIQAFESDGNYKAYYNIFSTNWQNGRFDPVFQGLINVGQCVGGTLSRISPWVGCFFSTAFFLLSSVLKALVQLGLDLFNPSQVTFEQSWYSGKYDALFNAEDSLFYCFSNPFLQLDNGVSCALYSVLNYAVALMTDAVDMTIVFKQAVTRPENIGLVIESALDIGRLNATYKNSVALASCLSEIGGNKLGKVGCVFGSVVTVVNGFFKGGLRLFVDVSKSFGGGASFVTLFSISWNTGLYDPFFQGLNSAGECLGQVFSLWSDHASCIAEKLIDFVSALLRSAIQLAVDLIGSGAGGFASSWETGRYEPLWATQSSLVECIAGCFDGLFRDASCTVKHVLLYTGSVPRDAGDVADAAVYSGLSGDNFGAVINAAFSSGRVNHTYANTVLLASCFESESGSGLLHTGCLVSRTILLANDLLKTFFYLLADFVQASSAANFREVYALDWESGRLELPFESAVSLAECVGTVVGQIYLPLGCTAKGILVSAIRFVQLVCQVAHDVTYSENFETTWMANGYNFFFDAIHELLRCATLFLGEINPDAQCAADRALEGVVAAVKDAVDFGICFALSVQHDTNFGYELKVALYAGRLNATRTVLHQFGECAGSVVGDVSEPIGCAVDETIGLVADFLMSVIYLVSDVSIGVTQLSVAETFAGSWNSGVYRPIFSDVDSLSVCLGMVGNWASPVAGCFLQNAMSFLGSAVSTFIQMALDLFVTEDFDRAWILGRYQIMFDRMDALFQCAGNLAGLVSEPVGCVVTKLLSYVSAFVEDAVDMMIIFKDSANSDTNFGANIAAALGAGRLRFTYNNTNALAECAGQAIGSVYEPLGCAATTLVKFLNEVSLALLRFFTEIVEGVGDYNAAQVFGSEWNSGTFSPVFDQLSAFGDCLFIAVQPFSRDFACLASNLVKFGGETARAAVQLSIDIFATQDFENSLLGGKYSSLSKSYSELAECAASIFSVLGPGAGCIAYQLLMYAVAVPSDVADAYMILQDSAEEGGNLGDNVQEALASGRISATLNNTDRLADCLGQLGARVSESTGCIASSVPKLATSIVYSAILALADTARAAESGDYAGTVVASWNQGLYNEPFDRAYSVAYCLGEAASSVFEPAGCLVTNLLELSVEIVRHVVQAVFDTFVTRDINAKWFAGNYDPLFDKFTDLSLCVGEMAGFFYSGFECAVSSAASVPVGIFRDAISALLTVSEGIAAENLAGSIYTAVFEGPESRTRTALISFSDCVGSIGSDLFSPAVGQLAQSLLTLAADIGTAFVYAAATFVNAMKDGTEGGPQLFQQDMKLAWESGEFEFLFDSLRRVGNATGDMIDSFTEEPEFGCLIREAIDFVTRATETVIQLVCDFLLGGDFESNWESGKYEPLFESGARFTGCLSDVATNISSSFGCLVQQVSLLVFSAIRDLVGFFILVKKSVVEGENLGNAVDDALDSGAITNTLDNALGAVECAAVLIGEYSVDLSCLINGTAALAKQTVILSLRVLADFARSPEAGLHTSFEASWDDGDFELFFDSIRDLAACVGNTLSFLSPAIACAVPGVTEVAIGIVSDIIELLLLLTYGQGLSIWSSTKAGWDAGKLNHTTDAVRELAACFGAILDSLWDGLGVSVTSLILAIIYTVRNALYLTLSFASAQDSVQFGNELFADWDAGKYEAPFILMKNASAGISDMFAVVSPSIGCLAGTFSAGLLGAAVRDAARLFVLMFYSWSYYWDPDVSLFELIRQDLSSEADPDLNSVYNLLRTGFGTCLALSDLPREGECLVTSTASLVASGTHGLALFVVSLVAASVNQKGPIEGFCQGWADGAYEAVFDDANSTSECVGDFVSLTLPSLGCTVPSLIEVAPMFVHDLGDLLCALDNSSLYDGLSVVSAVSAFSAGWRAGRFQMTLSQITAFALCLASSLDGFFESLPCVVVSSAGLFVALVKTSVELIIIFSSALLPIQTLPAGAIDNVSTRVVLAAVASWDSGALQQVPNAIGSLISCVMLAAQAFDPNLGCALQNVVLCLEYAVLSAGDVLSAVAEAVVTEGSMAEAAVDAWDSSVNLSLYYASYGQFCTCLQSFLSELSSDLGCVITNLIMVAGSIVHGVFQSAVVVLATTYSQSGSLADEFDSEWIAGKFASSFASVENLASCLQALLSKIHPSLGGAAQSAVDVLVETVRSLIIFFVYVGQYGSSFSVLTVQLYQAIDNNATFINPIFNALDQMFNAIGQFFSIVDSDLGGLVYQVGLIVVGTGRNFFRLLFTVAAGSAPGSGISTLSTIKIDWRYFHNYNGGRYSAPFTAMFSAAVYAGNLMSVIDPSAGCLVNNLLSLIPNAFLAIINFILAITESDPFLGVNGLWTGGMFDRIIFNPAIALVNCLAQIAQILTEPSYYFVLAAGQVVVYWSRHFLGFWIMFNQIVIQRKGVGQVLDTASPFSAIQSFGAFFQSFFYGFSNGCPSNNFFCLLGDAFVNLFGLIATLARYIFVYILDAIIVGNYPGGLDAVLQQLQITLISFGSALGSLVPPPSYSNCSQDAWIGAIGRLIGHSAYLLASPLVLVNWLIAGVFSQETSQGQMLEQLVQPFAVGIQNVLVDIATIADCVFDTGTFFSDLASIISRLLTLFTTQGLLVIQDLLSLVVDLFTGNLSGFGSDLASLLSDFGNFFVYIATQILNAIIPGGGDALLNVLNFFTGDFCHELNDILSVVVSTVNSVVNKVKCLSCIFDDSCADCGLINYSFDACAVSSKRRSDNQEGNAEGWVPYTPYHKAYHNTSFYDNHVEYEGFWSGGLGRSANYNSTDPMGFFSTVFSWNGTSACDSLVRGYSRSPWHRVPFGDKVSITSCVQKRVAIIRLGEQIGWVAIPQDLLYNWQRPITLTRDLVVGAAYYASCVSTGSPCATSPAALAEGLEGMGVDYSAVLYVLGMAEVGVNKVFNFTAVDSMIAKMGNSSSLSVLVKDLWTLTTSAYELVGNGSSIASQAVSAVKNSTRSLRMAKNYATNAGDISGRSVVAAVSEHIEKTDHVSPSAIWQRFVARATKARASAESVWENTFHPTRGHVRTLVDSAFTNSRYYGACRPENYTLCDPADEPLPWMDAERLRSSAPQLASLVQKSASTILAEADDMSARIKSSAANAARDVLGSIIKFRLPPKMWTSTVLNSSMRKLKDATLDDLWNEKLDTIKYHILANVSKTADLAYKNLETKIDDTLLQLSKRYAGECVEKSIFGDFY